MKIRDIKFPIRIILLIFVVFLLSLGSANASDPNMPPSNGNDDHTAHCEAMGMADGSPHVDPPQNVLDQVAAEYEANCQTGNCFLGEGNYQLLESMGHTREKIDCFLQAGEDHHNQQHGGQHQDPNGQNHNGHDDHTAHCEAMGMADGSPHVDPPQNVLDQVAAEYESNCQAGNCFLSEANYQLLESMGHTREKVDCFLQAGEDHHNQQHGGDPNHGSSGPQ